MACGLVLSVEILLVSGLPALPESGAEVGSDACFPGFL